MHGVVFIGPGFSTGRIPDRPSFSSAAKLKVFRHSMLKKNASVVIRLAIIGLVQFYIVVNHFGMLIFNH